MAAYVEIVFDNSDGRLSVEGDEVVLRRSIGHKKDELFLNRKRVQKAEVISMLESAGFSKSNPYYIVQQGKVSALCLMKDEDRLDLLREVAGTTVYEERRSESLKIMQETVLKQDQIDEVLQFIEDRLGELEQEKNELRDYEKFDKRRRALEFSLYDRELTEASQQLENLEATREEEARKQLSAHSDLKKVQDKLLSQEEALTASRTLFDRLTTQRDEAAQEHHRARDQASSQEVELQELRSQAKAQGEEREALRDKLTEVNQLLEEAEGRVKEIEPQYSECSTRLRQSQREMTNLKNRINTLYGKQGRGRQFKSKADRDSFLQNQIRELQTQMKNKSDLLMKQKQELASEGERIAEEKSSLEAMQDEQRSRTLAYDQVCRKVQELTQTRNNLHESRKEGWRALEASQNDIQEARKELDRGTQLLRQTLPRHIFQGLNAVEQIAASLGLEGYHGPLIDNLELTNPRFRTAVEVAAANNLFHIVVDNDEVAARLVGELEKRKAGRLTFLPLNRLRNEEIRYPTSSEDVKPLINVALSFDPDIEPAIKQVFGRKLLAKNLEVADYFSKEYDLDAITIEGDMVNRKGGYEGGYRDERESRFGAVTKIREATQRIGEFTTQSQQLKEASERVDAEVNEILRELHKLEAEKNRLRSASEASSKDIPTRTRLLATSEKRLEERSSAVQSLERELEVSEQQQEEFQQEMASPLLKDLSAADRQELEQLLARQSELEGLRNSLQLEVMDVSTERDRRRADLFDNLLPRKTELDSRLGVVGGGGGMTQGASQSSGERDFDTDISLLLVQREHTLKVLASSEQRLSTLDEELNEKKSELTTLEKSVDKLRADEISAVQHIAEATKAKDRFLNKRSILLETIQAKQRQVRDLGLVPKKELEGLTGRSERFLLSALKEVNEELKKFSGVNRKALDQYVSFSEQRDQLLSRKDELVRDNQSISQLVETLDQQKDEAILRTFNGVRKHFSEVFSELVEGGQGNLVMMTQHGPGDGWEGEEEEKDEGEEGLEEEAPKLSKSKATGKTSSKGAGDKKGKRSSSSSSSSSSSLPSVSVSSFSGVRVQVRFAGSGQQFQMHQLSGGQKALVALALIFAIQRCDPAPFYLFDEIDQALDANYRASVARLIQRQARSPTHPAQFICTTFKPEIVSAGDKFYGISLQDKASAIHPISKADAQRFVSEMLLEEEAVGGGGGAQPLPQREKEKDRGVRGSSGTVRGIGVGVGAGSGEQVEIGEETRRSGKGRERVSGRGKRSLTREEEEEEGEEGEEGEDEEEEDEEEGEEEEGLSRRVQHLSVAQSRALSSSKGKSKSKTQEQEADKGKSKPKGKGKGKTGSLSSSVFDQEPE